MEKNVACYVIMTLPDGNELLVNKEIAASLGMKFYRRLNVPTVFPQRLRSRHLFVPAALEMNNNNIAHSAAQFANQKWKEEWEDDTSRLYDFVSDTGSPPRLGWVRLNCLQTGVGRFHEQMHKWVLASSAICECGLEEQTADHVIPDCPKYRVPSGIHDLKVLDDETVAWLLKVCPDIQPD